MQTPDPQKVAESKAFLALVPRFMPENDPCHVSVALIDGDGLVRNHQVLFTRSKLDARIWVEEWTMTKEDVFNYSSIMVRWKRTYPSTERAEVEYITTGEWEAGERWPTFMEFLAS